MNDSEANPLVMVGVKLEPTRNRRWLSFKTRHFMWLVAYVAILITGLKILAETVGSTTTTIEIIKYHPTGTVEFLVLLPNGFSQSGVPVPATTSAVDYTKLIGSTYEVRYRAQWVLWLPPQEPVVEAYRCIHSEVVRFANEEEAK